MRSSLRIRDDVMDGVEGSIHVAKWGLTRTPAHGHLGVHASLHIDALIVVLKLGLRTKDHEQELFIRRVAKGLAVRSDFNQLPLVHQVNE